MKNMEWVNWKFDEDVRGEGVEIIEIKALLWICTDSENVVGDLRKVVSQSPAINTSHHSA